MGAEGGDSSEAKVGGEGEEGALAVVNVRCSNGSKFTVQTSLEATVESFKALLAQNSDVPPDQQRLIYKGRILKDDQTLQSYGLAQDHTVHMVRGFSPGSTAPAPGAPATPAAATPAPGVTRGVGPTEGTGLLNSGLFPGMTQNPLAGPGGLPEFEQVQQQLTQNPNMMREIMNMPAIQSLMNNPDLMRNLIMSNPQMRDIIDRNPELAHILNDPGILRQTLEAARNPELMREMMRNTDRAMSNIESSPEGFNMLRRMYENVQEPFLNATTMTGNGAGNDAAANPFAALLGTQARDGSTNPLAAGADSATGVAAPNTNPLPNPWSNTTGGGTQANPARPNLAGETRAPGIPGLGGLGIPNMPDASQMTQMLQNPAISQMMQSLLSDPQYLNQILNSNPQLRGMADLNPQIREMMQNPELMRQMMNPEAVNQMLGLQQSLFGQMNRQPTTTDSAQTGATAGTPNNNGLDLLMNMFNGLGAGGLGTGGFAAPNNPNVPPEELYATQLTQLQEMGFFDTQENINALRATSGNVHAAVDRLLGNPGQ